MNRTMAYAGFTLCYFLAGYWMIGSYVWPAIIGLFFLARYLRKRAPFFQKGVPWRISFILILALAAGWVQGVREDIAQRDVRVSGWSTASKFENARDDGLRLIAFEATIENFNSASYKVTQLKPVFTDAAAPQVQNREQAIALSAVLKPDGKMNVSGAYLVRADLQPPADGRWIDKFTLQAKRDRGLFYW